MVPDVFQAATDLLIVVYSGMRRTEPVNLFPNREMPLQMTARVYAGAKSCVSRGVYKPTGQTVIVKAYLKSLLSANDFVKVGYTGLDVLCVRPR